LSLQHLHLVSRERRRADALDPKVEISEYPRTSRAHENPERYAHGARRLRSRVRQSI